MSAPTVGRIVHYMAHGSKDGTHPQVCRAAIVTEVTEHDDKGQPSDTPVIHLTVFNPTGWFLNPCAHAPADEMRGGTWHWPCVISGDVGQATVRVDPGARDERPHSRACGIRQHPHGTACAKDCPTCRGGETA